jgi:hypothetical protein
VTCFIYYPGLFCFADGNFRDHFASFLSVLISLSVNSFSDKQFYENLTARPKGKIFATCVYNQRQYTYTSDHAIFPVII